uniref:Uncharacterized protein n=1 Tax=Eutreptiella gymnastica TaxID=73025 RepID=A0A7S1NWQ7_9EUGL
MSAWRVTKLPHSSTVRQGWRKGSRCGDLQNKVVDRSSPGSAGCRLYALATGICVELRIIFLAAVWDTCPVEKILSSAPSGWMYLIVPSGNAISFMPSGKCFSTWLFTNSNTCMPLG